MSKLLKIIGRSAAISAEWILILFLFLAFAIRTYPVQTFLAKKLTSFLSTELQVEIKIEAVEIIFFDQVLLKNFSIKDRQKEVLFDMREIHVKMQQFALFRDPLKLASAKFSDGEININRHELTGEYNFQFLADYFEKPKDPNAESTILGIANIELSNVDFNYNDYREPEKKFGIDYNHIGMSNVNLSINNFHTAEDKHAFDIHHLSCSERSGFELKDFSTAVFIEEGSIQLDALKMNMGSSNMFANHLSLDFNSWDDFDFFEEQVKFNVNLDSSELSFKDIAFFVSDLKGMDEVISLNGKFTDAINQMKINDLALNFGQESFIRGDFELPDFSDSSQNNLTQYFSDIYIDLNDLKAIKMPDSIAPFSIDPSVEMNKFLSVSNLTIKALAKTLISHSIILNLILVS